MSLHCLIDVVIYKVLKHVSSKLCFAQTFLVNSKALQDLALSPLHDAISPRILAFTKPISALAFRFITRPMRFYTLHCLYSANFSLLFHCFASQCFTLPSQLRSRPPPYATQLYLANANQFISKANHVKSQPVQIISAHCLCRSQLCDTLTCLSISIAYPVLAIPQRFFAVQILCTTSHHWSLPLRFCA